MSKPSRFDVKPVPQPVLDGCVIAFCAGLLVSTGKSGSIWRTWVLISFIALFLISGWITRHEMVRKRRMFGHTVVHRLLAPTFGIVGIVTCLPFGHADVIVSGLGFLAGSFGLVLDYYGGLPVPRRSKVSSAT